MRILLTGANGFIGRRVLEALRGREHHVIAHGRSAPEESGGAAEQIASDLLEAGAPEALARAARPDVLVHLAWTVEHGRFWTDPRNEAWADASLRLARACAQAGARRIVATGTCYEYDWPADADCEERATRLATHTPYDSAKARCRAMIGAWAQEAGVEFAWARLFHLYGPGEHPERLVASVARALARGEPALCGSGAGLRDFMDSREASRRSRLAAPR